MKAHYIAFPRFNSITSKRRTVIHIPYLQDPILRAQNPKPGDWILPSNADADVNARKIGPFMRVTTSEVGLLTDFLKRRDELERLDTTLPKYLDSWRKAHGDYYNTPAIRLEVEYPGMPTDEETVEELCKQLHFVDAIKLQEDARVLREIEAVVAGGAP